jgi:tetratricopeptide (TPR) repeat protein
MIFNLRWALLSLVLVMLVDGCATTASTHAGDIYRCDNLDKNFDPATQVAACDRLINSGQDTPKDLSIFYNHRGIVYLDKRDYARATQNFDKALELRPDYGHALGNRGLADFYLLDFDKSLDDLNTAIGYDSADAVAISNRGMTYAVKGDQARSIADLDKAIDLDGSADNYNNRCYSLAILGMAAKAIPDCDKALAMQPGDKDFLDSRGYANQRAGNLDAAVVDFSAVIKADSTYDTSLFGRAVIYAAQGKHDLAVADLAAARAANPKIDQLMAALKIAAPAGM